MSQPTPTPVPPSPPARRGLVTRFLDGVERVGNKLPDPAVLFLILMLFTWALSALLANVSFGEIDPRSGEPVQIVNLLSGTSLTAFMASMVQTFVNFPPLGVVLVAMLGLGVAEHTGFINAALRAMLAVTPRMLLTPARHCRRHPQSHRGGRRLRAGDPAGRGDLLRGRAASAGRHRGGLRRRLGRVLGNVLRALQPGPAAGRPDPGGRAPASTRP